MKGREEVLWVASMQVQLRKRRIDVVDVDVDVVVVAMLLTTYRKWGLVLDRL
jgi:hypothetical protein